MGVNKKSETLFYGGMQHANAVVPGVRLVGPSSGDTRLHLRIHEDLKQGAWDVLNSLGITMAGAIRLFLRQVYLKQAFPFEPIPPYCKPKGNPRVKIDFSKPKT